MESEALRKFQQDFRKLVKLYNGTRFAFSSTAPTVRGISKDRVKAGTHTSPVYLDDVEGPLKLMAGNYFEFSRGFDKKLIRDLHEVLLIRLVSIIENYTIRRIRELFIVRRDLFKSTSVSEFSHNELFSFTNVSQVWSKVLAKMLRDLHSRGFGEVQKYYKKNFEIEFNEFSDKVTIDKMHDVRHLLVHRVGQIDEPYREKYGDTGVAVRIDIQEFETYLSTTSSFVAFLESKVTRLSETELPEKKRSIVPGYYKVRVVTPEAKSVLDRSHTFFVGEELVRLGDILVSLSELDDLIELKIKAENKVVKLYTRQLRKLEKLGAIVIEASRAIFEKKTIAPEDLERVRQSLPQGDLPYNIHKTLSDKLGLSHKTVFLAISKIRDEW